MVSAEQNRLMTEVGPATPGGKLLRLYWHPAALVDEFEGERPLRAVRLLGQDCVLFRDEQGRYGLLDRHCPHRGADLAYGRLEDGGLRCAFHGWLFDVGGKCLETPAEPAASRLCERVRQRAYPVIEKNGILFAYLGPGEAPSFPAIDCFVAPASHSFAFKGLIECNWMQALEVGIDPSHASYLHRFSEDENAKGYGRQFQGTSADSEIPMTRLFRDYARPDIDLRPTNYGMQIFALRRISAETTHVRVTNLLFPNAFCIPMSNEMTITQWQVPVDDTSCYWYAIFTSFGAPVDKATMRRQRLELYELPDYKPRVGRHNQWGYDPAEQKQKTFTGMGLDINVHDQWAVESQGRIQDRTREHLGHADKCIVVYRTMLVKAIEQAEKGERALMVLTAAEAAAVRGPVAVDGIGPAGAAANYHKDLDARRREQSSWAAGVAAAAE